MTSEEKSFTPNTAQLEAIQAIEGPVMVIAGPGTGKTEILSHRIGYILKQTDTSPGSILCLTYTDAAASEMRQRLIKLIGPEAYSIQVNTFHGFCNMVIQENPNVFQQARELDSISDIDKFRLIQRLIDSFDDEHPLKKFKGQTYSSWERLLGLFSTMKKENWAPHDMYQHIDEYVSRMENGDTYRYKQTRAGWTKGDLKPDFKKQVLDKMEVLKSAVAAFDHYNELLALDGKYDYDDMIHWVYEAFDQDPDLLANYQERFLYFLVDEFQDTNGIQIAILQKLIDHEFMDRPNIFVVGDDDQAIYRFQGANIQNLIEFKERYDPQIILLEENYRSSQLIIDAARIVMQPVEESLVRQIFGDSKQLKGSGKHADHPQHVLIHKYPTQSFENADIFYQLKKWYESNTTGSIATLYTKHDLGVDLSIALKGAGIPFQTVRSTDALQQDIIHHLLDILDCLRMLGDSVVNDDGLLYRILHLKYLHPPAADLQRLILSYTSKERDDSTTLFMWMGDPAKLDELHLQNRPWMNDTFALLQEGIANYHSFTLIAFVEWVTHKFGIMQWILKQKEKFIHLYTLKSFYNFVDEEAAGKSKFTVADLLDICEMMKEYRLRLPVQELAATPTGIHLSSLHGAKGLEYDTVMIKSFTENEWEKKRVNNKAFSFPDNLVPHGKKSDPSSSQSPADTEDNDRRRLIYVGMTRAKKELILSFANKRDNGKILTPSKYVTEIENGNPSVVAVEIPTNEEILGEYLIARMSGLQKVDLNIDNQEIKLRAENFVLNVSALNQYLECPLRFYYEKILKIPAPQMPYLIFGNSIHDALQKLFDKKFKQQDTAAGKDYLLWAFEKFMERNKHKFTRKEYEDRMTYGKRVLVQYYDHYAESWSVNTQYETEYKIRDVHIEGVPVTGFIDRIDKTGDNLMIYDYKTGRTDKYYEKIASPSEKYPDGGPYWRQMVFYDLLLEKDPRVHKHMSSGFIQALEPDKDGKFVQREIKITNEDRAFVSAQITNTYQKIRNMEFDKFCGECEWCRMHNLEVPIILGDEEEEA